MARRRGSLSNKVECVVALKPRKCGGVGRALCPAQNLELAIQIPFLRRAIRSKKQDHTVSFKRQKMFGSARLVTGALNDLEAEVARFVLPVKQRAREHATLSPVSEKPTRAGELLESQ